MRFVHPELLWLLTLLPIVAFFCSQKGPAPSVLFSSTSIFQTLGKTKKTRPGSLLLLMRLAILTLLILALARPQLGNSTTEIEASGIDILLAVDVSGSMRAMDFTLGGKPANRLEVVKKVVNEFIEERPNDRIGLLAFGGRPYLVCPLTLDHNWLQKRLESLEIGMVEDGTAIGSAIGSGVNRLRDQKSKSRILILLTDGMSNTGRVPPLVAAEAAETLEIKTYTIGAGTRGEAPIPVVDAFGRTKLMRMKVDLDEKTLRKVAEMTGATYFRATDTASLSKIYHEINKMETTTRTIKKFENYREIFHYFVICAIMLLGFEVIKSRSKLP